MFQTRNLILASLMAPEGTAAATGGTATTAKRERQFGRVYDHDNGTALINTAFDKEFKLEVALNKIPAKVLEGFALQAASDYIVNEASEILRDEEEGTIEERRVKALAAAQEAYAELVEGKVDFRSGVGLGGMRSAIGALGTVLFELGKTYVMNQRGEKLEFSDIHGARQAVKSLYLDTTPKGPFEPVVDENGNPVLDKDGVQKQKPLKPDSNLTGRMIFNAINEVPAVKEAMAAKRKAKKPAVQVQMG